ncbi:MAG: quinoprotein relay system zinc metallohydrolase 2 [Pseudomonadota bacterium]
MMRFFYLYTFLLAAGYAHGEALPMEQVGDNIYVHHGVHQDLSEGYEGDICNISFIVGTKGVAVIDSGGSYKTGMQLREAIRKVTQLPILYVINTHVHPDHIFGNAAFVQDKPAFVGHAKLADAMARRKDSYMRINQDWQGANFAGSEIIMPTIKVQDSITIDIGERTLTLTAYPVAHTNTDMTVLDSKSGDMWMGDLLFVERTPSIDGDIKGWIAVISQLEDSKVSRMIPGHGAIPADWKAALGDEKRYLATLLDDIRASIKKGEVMEKAMDTAAASEKGKWVLFEIVNRRNVNTIYPALEWE